MPVTSENVADRYGVSRIDQDAFALRSQHRADHAIKSGRFASEIVAVAGSIVNGGEAQSFITDEQPRAPATGEPKGGRSSAAHQAKAMQQRLCATRITGRSAWRMAALNLFI